MISKKKPRPPTVENLAVAIDELKSSFKIMETRAKKAEDDYDYPEDLRQVSPVLILLSRC